MDSTASDWVSETAFGKWFLSTGTWFRYVLAQAVADLDRLAAGTLPQPPHRLMDVGCGQGAAFSLLQAHFQPSEILAVDVDARLLGRARSAAAASNMPVTVLQANAAQLPLPDAHVDVVFCHQLIHHVAQQEAVLRELHRVLAPGGVLLMSESCKVFIDSWPVRWFFRHPPGVQKTAEGYMELVRAAGFTFDATRVQTYTPWWSLPDLGISRRLGLSKAPAVPSEVLIVATKA
jgi:SAM-dependent methyltransferase